MPAAASIAPKSAAPQSRSTPASRAPSKAPAPPKPAPAQASAPALPAFARSALPASDVQQRPAKPRPKIVPIAVKGAGHSPGKPLPPHIRAALENSFSVDLGAVRFHSDEAAQQTTGTLSARAFTYGSHIFLGAGEHPNDIGLMAHEAAHIVQQQGHSSIQMWSPDRSDPYEREADRASSAVQRGENFTVSERVATPRVQRFPGIHKIRNYLADKAANIPGYTMFTVIMAYDPIRGEDVDRSGANILRAAVQIIPGGKQITDVLDQYKVFERVANWMGDQLDKLRDIGQSIIDAVVEFIKSLGISDVPHPFRVWERAVEIFTPPVDKIVNFIEGLAEGIWQFVRDAILKPLARLAEGKPGWDLLLAVLGKNPITGETVDSGPEAMIGGFMKLIHQEEIWENIKKANAIDRAWKWFKTAVKDLWHLVSELPRMFIDALKSLDWEDVILLPRGFAKVVGVFGAFFLKFFDWAGTTIWSLLQIIFEVVAPAAMPYLKRLGASFKTILKNPIGFVLNLVRAAKLGFEQFAAHILEHLRNAFIKWLTASMAGVYIPKSLDFGEIVKFILSVLGLTWANIRAKLVKAVGETAVKVLEASFDLVVTLVRDGPAAAWEKIKEYAENLKDMAMKAIMDYIVIEVVKKAVATIVSLFIPGASFIKAILAIYDTIVVFISKLRQMMEIATAFLDSMMEIASGNIAGAAKKVENALEGLLSLAIAFLAGFLHLGKIPAKIMSIIHAKISGPIDKAMDKVIDWIATGAKSLYSSAKTNVAKLFLWWKQKLAINADGEAHSLYFAGDGPSARLTVASEPKDIGAFLAERSKETAKNPKKAQAAATIATHIAKIDLLSKLTDDQQQARESEFRVAFNAIGQLLVVLLSETDWGTQENPAPLEYTKRRAAAYKTLYIGPKSEKRIPQALLEDHAIPAIEQILSAKEDKAWKAQNYLIVKCSPLSKTPLPDGGPTIGLDEQYQIGVGKKVPYKPGKTAGGGLINRTLAPYGYRATAEGMDGDHIVEMQIGGPNILQNLWPLDKGENRSSGALLSNAQVTKPDGKELPLDEANKKKRGSLWLMIVKTRG